MELKIKGRVVWVFGDHFDVDLIVGVRNIRETNPEKLARLCMADFDADFAQKVRAGDVVVAGRNFGYGHPHPQAMIALRRLGIAAVIAESFAPPFFRSELASGSVLLPCPGITAKVSHGDEIEVDVAGGIILNLTSGETIPLPSLSPNILDMMALGGQVPYLRKKLAASS